MGTKVDQSCETEIGFRKPYNFAVTQAEEIVKRTKQKITTKII